MIYGYFVKNKLLGLKKTKTHIYKDLSSLIRGPICGAFIVQGTIRQFKKLGRVNKGLNIVGTCGNCNRLIR